MSTAGGITAGYGCFTKLFLAGRIAPMNPETPRRTAWAYWSQNWRLMAMYYPAYVVLVGIAWAYGYYYVATAVFWFWIGRAIRDWQWCRMLAARDSTA
jgi:hypothetical protein